MRRSTALALISLLLAACSGGPQLPTPESLIQKHIRAAFGPDGLSGERGISARGRLIIEDYDIDSPISLKTEAPDKRVFQTRVMGEDVLRACAGGECWAREIDQPLAPLTGDQLAFMREVSDFYRLRNLDRYYRHLRTTGRSRFNGEPAWEVTLTRNNGLSDRWYFAVDDGLWLGGHWRLPRGLGGGQVTQYFEDYQRFDGRQLATEITEITPEQTSRVVIEEVAFGDIPDSEFKPLPR